MPGTVQFLTVWSNLATVTGQPSLSDPWHTRVSSIPLRRRPSATMTPDTLQHSWQSLRWFGLHRHSDPEVKSRKFSPSIDWFAPRINRGPAVSGSQVTLRAATGTGGAGRREKVMNFFIECDPLAEGTPPGLFCEQKCCRAENKCEYVNCLCILCVQLLCACAHMCLSVLPHKYAHQQPPNRLRIDKKGLLAGVVRPGCGGRAGGGQHGAVSHQRSVCSCHWSHHYGSQEFSLYFGQFPDLVFFCFSDFHHFFLV